MNVSLSCSLFKFKRAHFYFMAVFLLAALSSSFITPAYSVEVHPSHLTPSTDTSPVLTLVTPNQEISISMAQIESLPLFETEEMRHFDGPEGRFSGVWLDDFLIKYGLNDVPRLRFIAIDGYEGFIQKENREKNRYLMATRLNSRFITPENLGPLMLIIPSDVGLAHHLSESKNYWIWAINEIVVQ